MIKNYFSKMLLSAMLSVASVAAYSQATHTILVGNTGNDYSPALTNCVLGDTIRFQWVSGVHPTKSDDNTTIPEQDIDGSPGNGSVYKVKMTKVGHIRYYCTAHGGPNGSGMSGVIAVAPSTSLTYIPFAGTGALNTTGWITHSGTAAQLTNLTTASDNGNSLAYTGMAAPLNNRTAISSTGGEDINYPINPFFASSDSVVYFSTLVKVLNTTSLSATGTAGAYFMHLSDTLGTTGVTTGFVGRLSIRTGSVANTFNLGILNNSSGAPTPAGIFGATPVDYAINQTYLVIVKYRYSTNTASLWVNPSSLITPPAPLVVNNQGTTTAPTKSKSICIRQATGTGNVEIDEIRVGRTWNEVTSVNPPPSVRVSPTFQVVSESAGNATLNFEITNPNSNPTSFDVVLKSGSATQGSDYTYPSTQTLTFPANSSTPVTLNIPIIDDTAQENDETFDLVIRNTTNGATIGTDSLFTGTISANDIITPVVAFVGNSVSKTEGSGTSVVDVMITNPSASATSVDVILKATGTTADGADFTFTTPTTVTFPGSSSATQSVSFTITDENVAEGAENIVLVLSNPTNGALIGTDSVFIITILANDQPVIAHFMPTTLSVNENAGTTTASIMVMGSNSNANPTSFDVMVKGGTATGSGTDYTFTNVTVTIPPMKDSTVNIPVSIVDDSSVEGSETITLIIKNITNGGTIPADSVLTITISDNDIPFENIGTLKVVDANGNPTYPLATPFYVRGVVYSGNFRPAGLQFSLVDVTGAITVFKATGNLGYTVNQGDSVAVYGKLSPFNGLNEIAADSIKLLGTGHTLHAPIVTTSMNEVLESDLIEFRNAHIVDPAQWTGTGSGFNVKITNNNTDTIEIRIVNSVDLYSQPAPVGTFNFVGIVSQFDNSDPKNSGYQLLPRRATDIYTIPTVNFSTATNSVSEGAGQVSVTVNLSKKAITSTSVNVIHTSGTATHGSDFNIVLPQTITFNPGDSTGGFVITIIDDNQNEPTEDFVLSFTSNVNCTPSGAITETISITDNDPVGIATSKAGNVKMYPNPANSLVRIKADENVQQVIVYNTLGQEVRNLSSINSNEMTLEVSEFAKGIYNVRVITEKGEAIQRLMVK